MELDHGLDPRLAQGLLRRADAAGKAWKHLSDLAQEVVAIRAFEGVQVGPIPARPARLGRSMTRQRRDARVKSWIEEVREG